MAAGNYNYALRYICNIEHREQGYKKEDADEKGLTDCLLAISILLPQDGSYSQAIVYRHNGKENRNMTQNEIFKAWMTLGLSLHDKGECTGWNAELVKNFSEAVRDMFQKGQSA